MAAVSENAFRNLEPTQAAALSLLLDLEAQWQNLLKIAPVAAEGSAFLHDLHGKQKAYEAFQTKLAAYNKQYPPGHRPEPALHSPARLGAWCRAMRNLCAQAERAPQSRCPSHLLKKVHWYADRIGVRLGQGTISRPTQTDTFGAVIEELDALSRWCDGLSGVTTMVSRQ